MSKIQSSVELLAYTLTKRNKSYTGGREEFYNFIRSAEFAGITPLDVMFGQIGIKMTRLEGLISPPGDDMDAPAILDTLLDLAGYATLAHAYMSAPGLGEDLDELGFPR